MPEVCHFCRGEFNGHKDSKPVKIGKIGPTVHRKCAKVVKEARRITAAKFRKEDEQTTGVFR